MFAARIARQTLPLMLIALASAGCAPGLRSVRLRTADGQERTTFPRPRPPVAVTEEEFQHATAALARDIVPVTNPLELARQRFDVPVRSGWFFYDRRTKRIAPLDPAAAADFLPADVLELTRSYLQWCQSHQEPGDCLRLLRHGYALDADGRYAVAMAIALGSVLYEMRESLVGMANMKELVATVVCAATMYLMLWALPEPISKGVAAILTAYLVAYLGLTRSTRWAEGGRR